MNPKQKNTLIASLGSALEYFDFVVYGHVAIYLSQVFFSSADVMKSRLYTLFIYSIGYIVRPLGGTISGLFGDIFGRKKVFLFLTGLMCISTLSIGLLPSYEAWGIFSTVGLIICRAMQGVSFGGEISGATTIIGESSSDKNRAINTSFMLSGTAVGGFCATASLLLLTNFFSKEEMSDFGWRIPFILGGTLGIFLWVKRQGLVETMTFDRKNFSARESLKDILQVILKNYKKMLLAMSLCAFTYSLLTVNIFYPTLLNGYFGIVIPRVYQATTISLAMSCFLSPLVGWLLKYFSKYRMLMAGYVIYALTSVYLFLNLEGAGDLYVTIFMVINQVFISLCFVCHLSIIYDLLPGEIRYTSLAFSTNVVTAVVSLLPTLITDLQIAYQKPIHLPLVLIAVCMISFFAMLLCKKTLVRSSSGS